MKILEVLDIWKCNEDHRCKTSNLYLLPRLAFYMLFLAWIYCALGLMNGEKPAWHFYNYFLILCAYFDLRIRYDTTHAILLQKIEEQKLQISKNKDISEKTFTSGEA